MGCPPVGDDNPRAFAQEYQAPQKIFEIFAIQKYIAILYTVIHLKKRP